MSTPTDSKLKLNDPVQFLKGVGPHKARLLEKLGLRTAADLLFCFPRKYQDFREVSTVADLEEGQLGSVVCEVIEIESAMSGTGKPILYVLFKDESEFIRGVWFGQNYLAKKFRSGQKVLIKGKAVNKGKRFQMTHPKVIWLDAENDVFEEKLLPIYPGNCFSLRMSLSIRVVCMPAACLIAPVNYSSLKKMLGGIMPWINWRACS